MNRIALGFKLAAAYNLAIIPLSQGFGDALGRVDPLFAPAGCVAVLLWGAAYFSIAHRFHLVPGLVLVFAIEKAFYGLHWLAWMSERSAELPTMLETDPLTGIFYSTYGAGDFAFMAFFGWVAYRVRTGTTAATPD